MSSRDDIFANIRRSLGVKGSDATAPRPRPHRPSAATAARVAMR